ncbi:MAG: hypothetical protein HFJ03_03885 [Lachnospira sp.]|nr:hypothetical protein [Lachnospira sp.]
MLEIKCKIFVLVHIKFNLIKEITHFDAVETEIESEGLYYLNFIVEERKCLFMLQYHCPDCGRLIGYKGLCWLCKADKKRTEALNLTKEEIEKMQQYCIENVEKLNDMGEPESTYFWNCLSYHHIISEELQRAAVKKEVYYPYEIYYKAPEDVRDGLIDALMNCTDAQTAGHLMGCLAMQGDDRALEVLFELKKNPREWRKNLYVDSDFYAELGGWRFDEDRRRIQINYPKCYSLEKKISDDKAIVIGKIREDTCPHCKGKLVDMLSIDTSDERLKFLEINGKITVTCCPSCVMEAYPAAFGSYDFDGTGNAIFPYDGVAKQQEYCWNDAAYNELEKNELKLSDIERPVFFGANDWDIATIGGYAHWIQDCNIINCPDCKKPMRYLAQLPWDILTINGGDGSLYIEICPDCKKVSLHHQQT